MTTAQGPRIRVWALVAGPLAGALVAWALPAQVVDAAGSAAPVAAVTRATTGVLVWMAVWWLTEAIDIAATALLPLVLFPPLGIASIEATAAPYGSDVIFLFLGGFLLALAMQRWGLDRRLALVVVRAVGTRPPRMLAGFMLATATMSAFVSNTATATTMLPIALSVLALVDRERGAPGEGRSEQDRFGVCLMLGIAWSASIGGLASVIGSPPNGIFVKFMATQVAEGSRRQIGFAEWLLFGVPLAAVYLPLAWWVLTRLFRLDDREVEGGRRLLDERYEALGPVHAGEKGVLAVFALAVAAWIFRPFLGVAGLSDAGIAMTAGVLLFVLPAGGAGAILDWATAKRLEWGVLVLFGGGLSLAAAVKANGVAELVGVAVEGLGGAPHWVLVLATITTVIFLTELTSNTATTATLLPILGGLAAGLGLDPLLLCLPAALAASCAFMLPVGTPPNALVFASGRVTIRQMARAGIWLNVIGIALLFALVYALAVPLYGLR